MNEISLILSFPTLGVHVVTALLTLTFFISTRHVMKVCARVRVVMCPFCRRSHAQRADQSWAKVSFPRTALSGGQATVGGWQQVSRR